MIDREDVLEILRGIPDPEMPISIVDLGLVQRISIEPRDAHGSTSGNGTTATHEVHIDLLPTFIGCPALEVIAGDVRARIGALPGVASVHVKWLFDPPWSVDRISLAGRASLKEHGVAVPLHGTHLDVPGHDSPQSVTLRTSAVPCPFCGSRSTFLDSPFGPTRCRTIYYCEGCRNSFERLKRV